jgi:hypothetical protein
MHNNITQNPDIQYLMGIMPNYDSEIHGHQG